MPGDFSIKNSMSLEEIWTNIANSNKDGDPNSIDSKEEAFHYGSIYFIEEGMTEQDFYAKNLAIYNTQPKIQNGMYIMEYRDKQKETLSSAVSRIVNQMLDNGQFEEKKDVIMGKISYLNKSTLERVKSNLSPEEQKKAQEHWDRSNKTPDTQSDTHSEQTKVNAEYEQELERYKKEDIKEQASKNGIVLSEEEIRSLNAEDLVLKIRDTYATDDAEKAEAREKELDAFVANRKARSKEDNQAEAKRILTEYGDTFDFKNFEQTIDFAGMALISKDSDLLLKALEVIMPFASNNSSDNNDKIVEALNTAVPNNPYKENNRVSQQDVINLRSAIIKQLYDNETQKGE